MIEKRNMLLFLLVIVISAGFLSNAIPEVRAWEVLQHVTCKNVRGGTYETMEPVDVTSAFSINDERVCSFCLFSVVDVQQYTNFQLVTKWYDPDANMHRKDSFEIHGGSSWKSWRNISIKGQALKKGKWSVEWSFDGGPFKDSFTIGVRTANIQLAGVLASLSANVLIDGKPSGAILGSERKSFEFLEGERYKITIDEYVSGATGVRYHCSDNTWTIYSEGPLTESHEFTYETEFQLTVDSPYGTVTGAGWYKKGSTASFSVSPTTPLEGLLGTLGGKRVFQRWTGDSSVTSSSSTIVMDAPHHVTALWQEDIMMPMMIIIGLAAGGAVVVVIVIVARRKRGRIMPITPAETPTSAALPLAQEVSPVTPESPGVLTKKYCMLCGEELSSAAGFCTKCGAKQES